MRHSSTRVISSAHTRAKKKEPETPCSGLIFSLFLCQERGLCCSLFLPFCFLCTFFLLGDSVNVAHFRLISFEFQCNYTEATHGSGPSAAAMEVFFFFCRFDCVARFSLRAAVVVLFRSFDVAGSRNPSAFGSFAISLTGSIR